MLGTPPTPYGDNTVTGSAALNQAATPAPITTATALSGTAPSDSLTTSFVAGDTITVDGTVLTFVASGATGNQLNVTDTVGTLLNKIGSITGVTPTSTPARVRSRCTPARRRTCRFPARRRHSPRSASTPP